MENIIQTNRKFFNRIAKWYEINPFKKINKRMFEKISRLIKVKDNSRVLDAGCGIGSLLQIIYSEGKNLELYGIDISKEMLKIAGQKLNDNAELSLKSVEKIDFKDRSFDYIFSIDAFHHYANQKLAIRNFYRILKNGGKLIVVDFSFGIIGNWIFHHIEIGNTGMHTNLEYKQLFKGYKFRNIQQRKTGLFTIVTTGVK